MMHKFRKTVPVGINPVPVWLLSLAGFVSCVLTAAGSFHSDLLRALNRISDYYHEAGVRIFRQNAEMDPFKSIGSGFDIFKVYFLILIIFSVFCIAYHFMGSKSIYTMRRLKKPLELYVRCFTVPVLFIAVSIAAVYILNYSFIKSYLSVVPEENLSYLWDKNVWRVWL